MSSDTIVAETIRARRLAIEDERGNRKIVLGTTDEGYPGITLQDDNGVTRLQLIVLDGNSPKVMLSDSAGQGRLQLVVDDKDNAGITIFHDNDKPWLFITTDGYQHYCMCLFDRDGDWKPLWVGQIAPRA